MLPIESIRNILSACKMHSVVCGFSFCYWGYLIWCKLIQTIKYEFIPHNQILSWGQNKHARSSDLTYQSLTFRHFTWMYQIMFKFLVYYCFQINRWKIICWCYIMKLLDQFTKSRAIDIKQYSKMYNMHIKLTNIFAVTITMIIEG